MKLTHLKTIFNLCFMSVDSGLFLKGVNFKCYLLKQALFIKQQKANPGVSKDVIILSGSKFSSSKVGWYSVYQDQTQDLLSVFIRLFIYVNIVFRSEVIQFITRILFCYDSYKINVMSISGYIYIA